MVAVALVFVMLVPMPPFLLDLLLSASLTASVLVLLVALITDMFRLPSIVTLPCGVAPLPPLDHSRKLLEVGVL